MYAKHEKVLLTVNGLIQRSVNQANSPNRLKTLYEKTKFAENLTIYYGLLRFGDFESQC